MTPVEAIVYGLIQGATEYIPVSSTAHLLIAPWLFGWAPPSAAFDVLVQLGTLGAVMLYLRRDLADIVRSSLRGLLERKPLIDEHATRGWMIVVATIPAVVFGLLFDKAIDESMGNARSVFVQLVVNGLMLAGAELVGQRQRATGSGRALTWPMAIAVGFGQALAIIPAISRSGATIATALVFGVHRGEAARFSFLMSIPVMLGAGVLKGAKLVKHQPEVLAREGQGLLIAFVVAAVVGFAVIAWLQGFLRRHTLYGFAAWCVVVGVVGIVLRIEPAPASTAGAGAASTSAAAPAAAGDLPQNAEGTSKNQ
jgi:undecaprenyl-diphosphatase